MISNAVGSEWISRIVGYKLTTGNFSETSPNLPQRIAILGEANTTNQSTLNTDPVQITSARSAGQLFGYGSPIHHIARILFPLSGGTIGGVPVWVYPQANASGAAARIQTITVTGTATANGTHTLLIAGRTGIDGVNYNVNILAGDTPTIIAGKIADAINAVLGSPVSATAALEVVTATAKWEGLTSQDITIEVKNNGVGLGVTYAVAETTAGSGTPSVGAALQMFGNEWNTIVINSYGLVSAVMDTLEAYNGRPDPANPTGRYTGVIMKPFIALSGSTAEDPSSIVSIRKDDVTIAVCPAPLSKGLPLEAAANMCCLAARVWQDTPHLDVSGMSYPDMPTPSDIGDMSDHTNRNVIVQKGCSTVDLVSGRYQVQDFVTTYHKDGEIPPQFRYCRNLMLDFNVRFGYYLLELLYVKDHAIAGDKDVVTVNSVIKPKIWKGVLFKYAEDLAKRALIADALFMQESVEVAIGTTNPDRLETFFRYKRTGTVRIASTTAEAGFNFGKA